MFLIGKKIIFNFKKMKILMILQLINQPKKLDDNFLIKTLQGKVIKLNLGTWKIPSCYGNNFLGFG